MTEQYDLPPYDREPPVLFHMDLLVLLWRSNWAQYTEQDVKASQNRLIEDGLLQLVDGEFKITKRGLAHIYHLMDQELPKPRVVWSHRFEDEE